MPHPKVPTDYSQQLKNLVQKYPTLDREIVRAAYHKASYDIGTTVKWLEDVFPPTTTTTGLSSPTVVTNHTQQIRTLTDKFPTLGKDVVSSVYYKVNSDAQKAEEKLSVIMAIDPVSLAMRGTHLGKGEGAQQVVRDHDEKFRMDVAKKKIVVSLDNPRDLNFAQKEIDHLRMLLKCRHIVSLYNVESSTDGTTKTFTLSMELCSQWTVRHCMPMIHPASRVSFAKKMMRDMMVALRCMRDLGISHRDIKPENILLHYNVEEKDVCNGDGAKLHFILGDLGMARQQVPGEAAQLRVPACDFRVGTQQYMAPELFQLSSGSLEGDILDLAACDVWALGCVLVEVLTNDGSSYYGTLPVQSLPEFLQGEDYGQCVIDPLVKKQLKAFELEDLWDLVCKMLTLDASKRISIERIAEHPFLK